VVERPGSSRNLRAEWRRCGGGYGADGTVLDVGGRDPRERRRMGTPRARDGVADRPAPPGLTRFCGSRETSGRPARRRRWRAVPGRAAGLTVATAMVVLAGAASATAVDAAPAVELPAASTTGPSGGGATAPVPGRTGAPGPTNPSGSGGSPTSVAPSGSTAAPSTSPSPPSGSPASEPSSPEPSSPEQSPAGGDHGPAIARRSAPRPFRSRH